MVCFTEQQIEKMVWGEAAAGETGWGHLFHCDRCRERYLALTILHQATLSPLSTSSHAFPASPASSAARTIRLLPLQTGARGVSTSPRLAAQGEQPDDSYFVSSFANAEAGMIGRLLFHRRTRHLTLYLIADTGQIAEGLKVTLDDGFLTGYPDHHGCLDFGEQTERRFSKMELSTPRGICNLAQTLPVPDDREQKRRIVLPGHPLAEIDLTIECQPEGTRYIITCTGEASAPETAELDIVGITSKRILPVKTRAGTALLQVEPDEEMLKIHIY